MNLSILSKIAWNLKVNKIYSDKNYDEIIKEGLIKKFDGVTFKSFKRSRKILIKDNQDLIMVI